MARTIARGSRMYSGSPAQEAPCQRRSRATSAPACSRRMRSGGRGIAVPARHEELDRQLGAELARARELEDALADAGELVAHAAVVVVVGDLLRCRAAAPAPRAQLGQLADAVLADHFLPQGIGQLRLVVDLQLLAQVHDDEIRARRALVVELALRVEARRRLDADEVR